jgi:hypothetical protein
MNPAEKMQPVKDTRDECRRSGVADRVVVRCEPRAGLRVALVVKKAEERALSLLDTPRAVMVPS